MIRLVYKYLTQNFYIDVEYETIKPRRRNEDNLYDFYGSYGLTDELNTVFGIPREYVKEYIKSWIEQWYDEFPFDSYWNRPKLNVKYSSEIAQDLRAYGIDITDYLSSIREELDNERRNQLAVIQNNND